MPREGKAGWDVGRYWFNLIVPQEVYDFIMERSRKEGVDGKTIIARAVREGLEEFESPEFRLADLDLGLVPGQRMIQKGSVWFRKEDSDRIVAVCETLAADRAANALGLRTLILMGLKTIYGWTMAQALQPSAV